MKILAIDPGNMQSAFVILEHKTLEITKKGLIPNEEMLILFKGDNTYFGCQPFDAACIEYPKARGQLVSNQLMDAIYWIGRFDQACAQEMVRIDRKDVKMTLCGVANAKDSNIRAALIAAYSHKVIGKGGRIPEIGCAGAEGPLYGIKKDIWAALGVAFTYMDTLGKKSMLGFGEKECPTGGYLRKSSKSYSKRYDRVEDMKK